MMVTVPAHSADLVGRDAELEELSSRLGIVASARTDGDRSGRPDRPGQQMVLLAGDAGVGKTRLLTELRDRAHAAGWQAVAGHSLDLGDSALPYLAFSEILGRLVVDQPGMIAATLEDHPALARLQPGRRIRSLEDGREDGGLQRADLFEAVHALLTRAAADAPLLVIVEDTHWADQSTRDLLSFLFTRPFETAVHLVVSYRSDDLHRRHPLRRQVAEWSRLRDVERIQLDPLAAPDVRRLVRLLHPDPIAESDVVDIVTRAEGNAFFVEELVGATWETGGVPADLADLLLVRLDRLDDAARQVVRTAAVAGRQVSHHLLAAASGVDPRALDGALRDAVEMNVLVPVREAYAFRHALLGEAVYDDLLPGERVRLHASYAAVLRTGAAVGTSAELARHARLGQDPRTALFASIEAGTDAMRVGGPEEAAQHFEQALTLVCDPAVGDLAEIDLPDLVVRTADALTAAGHVPRANAMLREQLEQLPADATDVDRGRLMTSLALGLAITDHPDDEVEMARLAVELVANASPQQRARSLAGYARILSGHLRHDEARDAATEALALTRQLDMPRLSADIHTTLAGLDRRALVDEIGVSLREVIEQARAAGAVNAELRARYLLGRFHQDRAEFDESATAYSAARSRGVEVGTPWAPFAFESRFMEAVVLYIAGRWDSAAALADTSGQSPPPIYEAMLTAVSAQLMAGRGDSGAIERARSVRSFWAKEGVVGLTAATALLELAEQAADVDLALTTYDDIVGVLSKTWHDRFQARLRLGAQAIGVLGTAAARLSASERDELAPVAAEVLADGHRVYDYHRELGVEFGPEARAWIVRLDAEHLRWRWAAQLDPPDEASLVEAWRDTEARFAEYAHAHELARVRARLAAVLRGTDPATSRELADAARASARELGAAPLVGELVALGSQPVRREPAAVDALTPREQEILELVAQGRSNGEIGKQLFISAKTVSVHVSNILGKFGAASRTEAAAIARRRGLLA